MPLPGPVLEGAQPAVKLQLTIEAKHLSSRLRKAFVVLYVCEGQVLKGPRVWTEAGRTESADDGKDYFWTKAFELDYREGETQFIRAKLHAPSKRGRSCVIGECASTFKQLMLAYEQRLVLPLKQSGNLIGGHLVIRAEQVRVSDTRKIGFTVEASKLRKGRFPYFVLSRESPSGAGWDPVIRSESHRSYSSTERCTFKRIDTTSTRLTNNDNDRKLKIELFDSRVGPKDYSGGQAIFTLSQVIEAMLSGERFEVPLIKVKSRSSKEIPAGSVRILDYIVDEDVSFLDYVKAGCTISTVVAVDFSATNGDPRDPQSPHHISAYDANEYEAALKEIGNLLASNNTHLTFPAWGFSARVPPHYSEVSQCFSLNGNDADPTCFGIDGVLAAYRKRLSEIQPGKPCLLAPVLRKIIEACRLGRNPIIASGTADSASGQIPTVSSTCFFKENRSVYTVLLLLTDGDFADYDAVKDVIDAAAELPISILIVSVGNAECTKLIKLQADHIRLSGKGRVSAARDVLQYIPFHKYRGDPAKLSSVVFKKIPDQLVGYMKSKGISPSSLRLSIVRPSSHPDNHDSPSGEYGYAEIQEQPYRLKRQDSLSGLSDAISVESSPGSLTKEDFAHHAPQPKPERRRPRSYHSSTPAESRPAQHHMRPVSSGSIISSNVLVPPSSKVAHSAGNLYGISNSPTNPVAQHQGGGTSPPVVPGVDGVPGNAMVDFWSTAAKESPLHSDRSGANGTGSPHIYLGQPYGEWSKMQNSVGGYGGSYQAPSSGHSQVPVVRIRPTGPAFPGQPVRYDHVLPLQRPQDASRPPVHQTPSGAPPGRWISSATPNYSPPSPPVNEMLHPSAPPPPFSPMAEEYAMHGVMGHAW